MKVLFISTAFESIGIEALSAYLKKNGHETELVFDPQLFDNVFFQNRILARTLSLRKQLLTDILVSDAQLVAFSVTGFDLPWAFSLAEQIKKQMQMPIVFGGPHALICPEQLVESCNVDYVVLGEGEVPLLEIVEQLETGAVVSPIPNTWRHVGGIVTEGDIAPPSYSLDELPFPDKELYYGKIKHLFGYTVTTSRDCDRGCSFCSYNIVKKGLFPTSWRRRSVKNVLVELESARSQYNYETVRFYDNNFARDPAWLMEFTSEYKERIGVPYHVQANPDSLSPSVIDKLSHSGCFEIQIGVQTINPETRKEIGRIETLDQVRGVVRNLRRAGIRCCVDLIFGLPGEGEEDALKAGLFFNENRPTKFNIFWLNYLPKSEISRQAFDKGVLNDEDLVAIDSGKWIDGHFGGKKTRVKNQGMVRMQMLLTLQPVISQRVFEWLCRKRIYRLFPTTIGPHVFWTFVSALVRHPMDIHRIRYSKLHLEFLPRALFARFRRPLRKYTQRKTRVYCHSCEASVEGKILKKGKDLYIRRGCGCGKEDSLFWRNTDLYSAADAVKSPGQLPDGIGHKSDWKHYAPFATTLALDVTNRCNLACPVCVSTANSLVDEEPSVEEILQWLPDIPVKGFRPNVALVGGESTLREDLPEIVQAIVGRGYVPRLNSNGINLLDEEYLGHLKAAGLRWVILQHDGFSPSVSVKLRGEDYTKLRQEVVEKLSGHGFSIHLAVMVVRGLNDAETGDILRYSSHTPAIKRVSFYPKSSIGRFEGEDQLPATYIGDVVQSLETGTDGQILQSDLLASKRLGKRLFRLTGNPTFRQHNCIFPFLLYTEGDELVPVTRFINPGFSLRNPTKALKLLMSAPKMLDFDRGKLPEDILFVNIEKFYDHDCLLTDEALNCHHFYMTRKGFVPFCLYNHIGRRD